MGENHLTYFKIQNFKRFDSFEMENIGQFNLIVGDNNVGKTSVLEALSFNDGVSILISMVSNLRWRKILPNEEYNPSFELLLNLTLKNMEKPLFYEYVNRNQKYSNSYKYLKQNNLTDEDKEYIKKQSYQASISMNSEFLKNEKNGKAFDLYFLDNIFLKSEYSPLIFSNIKYNDDLLDYYFKEINSNKNQREEFEKNLKAIIPNLDEIRTHKIDAFEFLAVSLINQNILSPLTQFGDGAVKYARILLEILMVKGKRLMIDEIETGIHFSRLKDFWKTVILLCKKYDVQLFATTHSLECQRYFLDAFSELGEEYQKEARNISLLENQEGNVESVTYDFEQFGFAMEIGFNTRGGF